MNNVIAIAIAIISLVVAIVGFTQGHMGRYQISSTGDNLVFRLDTVSGHMTAHKVDNNEEPYKHRFIQEVASMAR